MFTSITGATGPSLDDEQIPTSSPPWVWVGFLFAGAFFVLGVISVLLEAEEGPLNIWLILIGLAGYAYWLICVHRLHKIMAQLTHNRYSISPGEAVIKHFVPILSIIWIFQWPAALSEYINQRGRVKMISGYAIGAMLLLAILLRWVDGSFGTAFLFGVTMYVSAKLKKHVKTLKTVTADQLPPLPDPKIFSRPVESSTAPAREVAEESRVG
jgi:hypothetical protein